ncbi:hypothetical protein COCON_G00071760 [Conger conger]|uniref:Endonuclease domain-containing 1 protein-like n=1 Tax=Conger conger TaxID=82655 RepID=A0A9Q1DN05_CONCO|nr:hypothetical protein COCON_G00071760 [Conger conger]
MALPWQLVVLGVVWGPGCCSVGTVPSPDCSEFLFGGRPPAGLEHPTLRYVCQRLNGRVRFLTLYDPVARIPVYSAYRFHRSDGLKRADAAWMYEPQLSDVSESGEMQPIPPEGLMGRVEAMQAVLEDYSDSVGFVRGQLNPDEHQSDPEDKAATYTLTNVVPQDAGFTGPWARQNHRVRQRLNNYCRGPAHIVTGVTTSGLAVHRAGLPRVAVPTYLWSAYCCPEFDRNAPPEERARLPAFAARGQNRPGAPVSELHLAALQDFLRSATYVPHSFQIFLQDCFPGVPRGAATVVEDFNHVERCKDSLYMGTPPRGFIDYRLKRICQRYADRPRYVTLYDPQKRIPVYSAYTFKKTEGDRRVDYPWMYEPQLAEVDGNGNMMPFPQGYLHMKFEDSQAVLDDYSDVVLYERGHLNPDQHQSDPHDRAATYTLTNVVPEIREFNIGPWQQHEERIRIRLNNYCRGSAYIVTGVTTAGHVIRRNNQDRVGIPEDVWTAYCCTEYDRNAPPDVRIRFPAHAALAKNAKEANAVHELTVLDLETYLKGKMDVDQNFQIFYDNCVSPSPLPQYLHHTI